MVMHDKLTTRNLTWGARRLKKGEAIFSAGADAMRQRLANHARATNGARAALTGGRNDLLPADVAGTKLEVLEEAPARKQ